MKRRKLIIAGTAVAALAATATMAMANNGGDDDATDTPIEGSALARASAAALEHTGGGRVTGTEVGDEESYYEVEVTRADGGEVDVQLDRNFAVVGSEDEDAGDAGDA